MRSSAVDVMSYDLAMKRRVFLNGVLVFVGLLALAWVVRPATFREQIEHQGIHLTEISHESREHLLTSSFSIPRDEVPKLKAWLTKEGFQNVNGSSADDFYYREHRILYFFRQRFQTVKIIQPNDGSVMVSLTDR